MPTVDFYKTRHEMSDINTRLRSGIGQEILARRGEYYRLRRLQKKGSRRTDEEKHIQSLLLKFSVTPIDNPIYEVFELSTLLGIPFVWHHPNDRLHTFLKGVIENAFKLIVIILKRLQDYMNEGRIRGFENTAEDIGAELDRRILENFDFHRQPFNVTGKTSYYNNYVMLILTASSYI
jgi:hypothetical protein